MSDYYCVICDKTIKMKCRKKHLNTRLHGYLCTSFVNRYCVKDPAFLEIELSIKKIIMIIMKGLDFLFLYVNGNWIMITLSSV